MPADPDEDRYAASFNPELLGKVLAQQGVHPDDVVTLLRWAPLGLTIMCWRNTVLEGWHARPNSRIGDADMMRANVATTRLFHQALWFAFNERLADGSLVSRDDFDDEDDVQALETAFADVLEDAFSPDRPLPHGPTLADIGGDEVGELYEHASTQLGALLEQVDKHGIAVVLMWLAAKGRLACADWWGSPRWPLIVDAFLTRLSNRDDQWWTDYGWEDPPAEVADTERFRHLLLSAPDALETETLRYCINRAGLRFIRVVGPGTS